MVLRYLLTGGAGARLGGAPPNNLVAALGDSITIASCPVTGGNQAQLSTGTVGGYLTWAAILPRTGQSYGDGKFRWGRAYGLSGAKTSVINGASYLGAVLAANPKPAFCIYLAGANDAASGPGGGGVIENGVYNPTNFAAWQTVYLSGVTQLLAAGIQPILPSLFPNTDVNYGNGIATYMNPWIATVAADRGLLNPDIWTAVHSGNGWAAGMNYDNPHPSVLGAKTAAQVILDAVYPRLPLAAPTIVTVATQAGAKFLWMNGCMTSDTDADSIPDGGAPPVLDLNPWTITLNGTTLGLAPRTGFDGNAWRWNKTTDPGNTTYISGGGAGTPPIQVAGHNMRIGFVAQVVSWAINTSIDLSFYRITDVTDKPMRLNVQTDGVFTDPVAPFVWAQDSVAASANGMRLALTISGTGTTTCDFYHGQWTVLDLDV